MREAATLLQQEVELLEIVQLVGPDALAEEQKAVLAITRMLREDFLQQSSYDEVDRYCPLPKAYWMLRVILTLHQVIGAALRSRRPLDKLLALPAAGEIPQMKLLPADTAPQSLQMLAARIESESKELL
jgi:V/A-type H+-transporting ATPase subunit A